MLFKEEEKIKKINIFFILIFGFFFIVINPLYSSFHTLETKNLRLIYFGEAHSYLVSHVARCFENSLSKHMETFDYKPTEKITVVLHDFSDFGNAGTAAVPNNRIFISIAPFNYVFEIILGNERMNWMMNHELVHVLASDQTSKSDRFFRSLFFGKVAPISDNPLSLLYGYLTSPRDFAPRWYHEGIAVFMETWMTGGMGRVLGSYDEMAFRSMIHEDADLYSLVELESAATKKNFQVGVNAYLYGTRFFSYLARQYGPENVIQWVSRSTDSKAYFSSQFKKVFGLSLKTAWSQWIQWEKQFQKQNLSRLRESPLTSQKEITGRRMGYISRALYDSNSGKIYVGVNYPGQLAHITALDINTGKMKKISNIKGPDLFFVTSLAYDPESGILFYTTDNSYWRDLKKVSIKSGRSTMLMKDCRVGDLAFNPTDRSLWGVRHYLGISTLVRIPYPYREWNQMFSWPYGMDLYDIDISPEGRIIVGALTSITGKQLLIKMDVEKLLKGDGSYETLYDFGNFSPANFIFSADGKYLFGSSYYSGVSNIYRYDLEKEDIHIISNCQTGLFRPVPISDELVMAFRYTSTGFIPVIIENTPIETVKAIKFLGQTVLEKYPGLKEWQAEAPSSVDLEPRIIYKGKYKILKDFKLRSIYPVVEGYKNYLAYGLRFNLSDSIPLNSLNFTASYTPEADLSQGERLHLSLNLTISNWQFSASHNKADFYDLFGPTKTSRKGNSVELHYKKSLIFDEPKYLDLGFKVAGYFGLEQMPEFQNIETTYDEFYYVSFNLNYKDLRASLGAVDYEKGFIWETYLTGYYVNNQLYPRIHTNLDLGFQLPIHHSAIWLRGSMGYAWGDREEPFANFYFGGFGNNWVDHQDFSRYRKYFSFPGVDLNEIGGTNYGKLMLEWTLPPVLFKRLGFSSFYASWMSVSLFSTGLITNMDNDEFRRELLDIGVQMDIRFMVLSNHQITLSLGYARAFQADQENSDEWMISIKIL
ncbi:MAG: hypothetical protein KAT17_06200 [Candidatus Aminicenantes bacterium]|nr:hypothetical protein [Candidatus Aminicenantes bacterium]